MTAAVGFLCISHPLLLASFCRNRLTWGNYLTWLAVQGLKLCTFPKIIIYPHDMISVSCHWWYLVWVFFRGWVGDQLRTKQFFSFKLQYFFSADYGSGRCIKIIVSFLFIDVNIWTVQPRLPDALLNQIFTTFLQCIAMEIKHGRSFLKFIKFLWQMKYGGFIFNCICDSWLSSFSFKWSGHLEFVSLTF